MKIEFRILSLFVFLMVSIEPVLAATGAEPWDGPLEAFLDAITGGTGRLIAAVAVAAVGIAAMAGKFSWGMAGRIIGGIVLIFGAVAIADFFIDTVA